VFREVTDGPQSEQDVSGDGLPAVTDNLVACRWDDPLERVEESLLSGADGVDHGGRNSFSKRYLSRECRPMKSRGESAIRSYYSRGCAEN
jgi:hypothetical protein